MTFAFAEWLARLRALLRRPPLQSGTVLRAGLLQVVQELESFNLTLYGLLRQMLLAAPLAPVDRITRAVSQPAG